MEIQVIVIWYDGNGYRASRCLTEYPDSTNPHVFFSGPPEVCDIIAVVAGPDIHNTETWIEEEQVLIPEES